MAKSADQFLDGFAAEGASANVAAANDTPPAAAVSAFRDAPLTGAVPEVGMQDPALAPLAQRQREDDILKGSPALQRFASRSAAHVAATKGDWSAMGALGTMVEDYVGPIKEAAAATAAAFERYRNPEAPKNLIEGLVPGFTPRDRALGELLMGGVSTALSPFFQGPANVAARPLSYVPGRQEFTGDPAAPFRPLDRAEAQRSIAGDLLEAASVPLLKVLRPPVRDLGTATEVGRQPRLPGPREPVVDADFEPIRPPGVRPEDTGTYAAAAEADAGAVAQMEEAVAGTTVHKELPALTKEFLDDAGAGEATVWVDPEVVQQLYFEGHTPFQAQAAAIGEALASGREVELPLSTYLSEVSGQPYAEVLRNATRFRDDGLSVDQATALTERDSARAEEVPEVRPAEGAVGEGAVGDQAGAEGGQVDVTRAGEGEAVAGPGGVSGGLEGAQAEAGASRFPPDIEPTPQVRSIAASADRAVEEVFAELRLSELFDPKALKLSKRRFEGYDAAIAEAQAAASDRILDKVWAQIRRERAPEWKDQVARQLDALTRELPTSRIHTARMALQFNQGPLDEPLETPPLKLDRKSVVEAYGDTVAETLPRSMFGRDGVSADDAADVLGYDSGEELLSDLLDSESAVAESGIDGYKPWLKYTLGEAAADAARAELGFDISPEALHAAALEAAVLPSVEDLLGAELKAAAEELGLPFDKAAVKAVALAQFSAMPARTALKLRTFEKGMWTTGERTQRALEKGDMPAAFIARQQQLLNFYQLEASHALRKRAVRFNKTAKRLSRNATIPGLSQPFLNHLHAYLPLWGFRSPREPMELEEALGGVSLPEFHAGILATNPAFPPVPEVEPAIIEDLTVAEFEEVTGFILAMNRYGRELQQARRAEKKDAMDAVVMEALASIPPGKPPKGPLPAPPIDARRTLPERLKLGVDWYDASHRKVADFVEFFDRGNTLGVWAQNTWVPMYEGADTEGILRREMYVPVAQAWKAVPKALKKGYNRKLASPFTVNGAPVEVYRRNIIPLALYAGTAESLEKAALGFGVDTETYLAFINTHITPEEVAMVEEVWGRFEALAPKVSEELRGLTGEGLRRVEASPVELGGKRTKGGYWPIRYNRDPRFNPRVAAWEAEMEAKLSPDGVDQLFAAIMPNKGFSIERTGYIGPVDVDMQHISSAFDAHIRYASYARAVNDVRKFIYHPAIGAAIRGRFGESYLEIVPEWLNAMVKPWENNSKLLNRYDRFFNGLARNITVGTLALSFGTLLAQVNGVANALGVLSEGNPVQGVGRLLNGYARFLGVLGDVGPDADGALRMRGLHAVFERSEFMRERFGALEQNMTEALMELENFTPGHLGAGQGLKRLERVGFQAIGWMEFATVSGPQWLAAEQVGLGQGLSPHDAVLFANRSVVKAQGSGRKVDLAAVQRFQGFGKLIYAFQSYFNQQYQLTVDVYRNFALAGDGGDGGASPPGVDGGVEGEGAPEIEPPANRYSRARGVLLFLTVLILGGMIGKWLRGDEWNPEDAAFDALRPMFGVNTGVRGFERIAKSLRGEKVNMSDLGFGDDLFVKAWDIVEKDARLAMAWNAKRKDGTPRSKGRVVQTLTNNLMLFGVPGAAQMGRSGEYLYQLHTGKQTADEWTDVYFGLTKGPQPEQAKQPASGSMSR